MEIEVDGDSSYVYTAGRALVAELPTIVFVHGAGADHSAWILQSRYFGYHGYNVLAVDLPGHGRSRGTAAGEIGDLAAWLNGLLGATGAKQAAVVGHSMGSLVALETAIRYPQRVSALALLGTALPMSVGGPLLEAAAADQHAAFDMVNVWGHSYRAQLGGNAVPGMWLTGAALRVLERSDPGILYRDLNACNSYELDALAVAGVQCPVLLILGSADMMTRPRAAQALEQLLPDSRTRRLEGCGHMMMSECPDAVLDALIEFL